MLDLQNIQMAMSSKMKDASDFATAETSNLIETAKSEMTKFAEFAGALTQSKTADEALNNVISYNALAFQRGTMAFTQSMERAVEFSKDWKPFSL